MKAVFSINVGAEELKNALCTNFSELAMHTDAQVYEGGQPPYKAPGGQSVFLGNSLS